MSCQQFTFIVEGQCESSPQIALNTLCVICRESCPLDSYGRTKFRSSDIHVVIFIFPKVNETQTDFVNMSFCSCNCGGAVETTVEGNGGWGGGINNTASTKQQNVHLSNRWCVAQDLAKHFTRALFNVANRLGNN